MHVPTTGVVIELLASGAYGIVPPKDDGKFTKQDLARIISVASKHGCTVMSPSRWVNDNGKMIEATFGVENMPFLLLMREDDAVTAARLELVREVDDMGNSILGPEP